MQGEKRNARFDQKKNMYYQGEWNSDLSHLSRASKYSSLQDKLAEGSPGFSALDFALYAGAAVGLRAMKIDINRANHNGNKWSDESAGVTSRQFSAGRSAIKNVAKFYGADDVGICKLNRNWIYSHYYDPECKRSYPIRFNDEKGFSNYSHPGRASDGSLVIPAEMNTVIVLLVEMDFAAMETAPTLPEVAATALAYSKLGMLVTCLTQFIRSLGYNAIPSLNCTGLNIPMAIDCGLGKLGRNGLLIHPRFGPRCRIAKVITDLPLPAGHPGTEYLHDYCTKCKKCALNCPAQAISLEKPTSEAQGDFSLSGYLRWQVDYRKCREYWVKSGTNCGVCIAVCTFNRNPQPSCLVPPEKFWHVERE